MTADMTSNKAEFMDYTTTVQANPNNQVYAPVQDRIHVSHQMPLVMSNHQQFTAWGPNSQNHLCHHCNAQVMTKVKTKANTKTHLWFLICCLFCCWICAPCVYCMKSFTVQEHYCPNCKNYLGMHNKQ